VFVEVNVRQGTASQQVKYAGVVACAHSVGEWRQVQTLVLAIAVVQVNALEGRIRRPGHRAKHVADVHRRQLIRVAKENQAGVVGHGVGELCHQREIHHRNFIDNEDVCGNRVVRVMAEADGIWNLP